ncbi:MAG: ATP-binding protein, partial [Bacteroidota bacterium]
MPITDKTSWQLSRQGALQSFETTSLFLPTPSPKIVLERRIRYLEERVSDKDEERGRGYFLGQGIQLELTHLKAFVNCLQHVFLETGRASEWVGNLANMDIRRSLQLTRDIMASPYIKVDELLKAYIAKTAQVIPIYDIQRAIIRRTYNFYPVGNHPFVQNIFSLRTEIGTSPLLGLRILTFLRDALHKETEGQEAFVQVSQLYDYFQAMMVERRVVGLWLDAMLRTGLCLSYDPTQTTIEGIQKVELSPSGRHHLFWGCADESYISSMMEVTPIQHQPTHEKLRAVPWENKNLERLEKTDIFIHYLLDEDHDYARIPDHEAYEGQRQLAKKLGRKWIGIEKDKT